MSYLKKFLPHGRAGGIVAKTIRAGVDVGIPAAMIGGFGYIENRYREKVRVGGLPLSFTAGIAGTLLGVFGWSSRYTRRFAPWGRRIGVAGLGAFAHTVGAGWGAQKSGVKRVIVRDKDVNKLRAVVPDATILGAIPQAPHGDFLSTADLRALAR